MADRSAIEWTEATWNPVTGCSKVSPGCAHCYAETLSLRFGWSKLPWTSENAAENVVLHPERLDQPLRWRRPRMVFVNSMSDLFHEQVPDGYIDRIFGVMWRAERHTFQVLTKRPERALAYLNRVVYVSYPRDRGDRIGAARLPDIWPLPNVWLGVSIENARHTWRADVLRQIPAAVRFISAEPLLGSLFEGPSWNSDAPDPNVTGRVTPKRTPLDLSGIDWLIVGGESGLTARPMRPEWARELRDACLAQCFQCRAAEDDRAAPCPDRTAFFFKQWGGRTPKANGRLLDGREWNEIPTARAEVIA